MNFTQFSLKSWKVSKSLGLLLGVMLIGGVAVAISLGAPGSPKAESAAAVPDHAKSAGKPVEKMAAPAQKADRKALAEALKQELANAKTAEEKREILQKFQAKNKTMQQGSVPAGDEPINAGQRLAEMKERAKGNPAMLERLNQMEVQAKDAEVLKSKMAAAQSASGEARKKLLEEVRLETRKLMEARQAEMPTREESLEAAKPASPQLVALQAKNEARKQEFQKLNEAMATASPQERRAIMDDWRKKQMAARKAQINNPEETNE